MTKSERQQSLEKARAAADWLRGYFKTFSYEPFEREVTHLLTGFEILDLSSRRPNAGRPRIETDNPKTLAQRRWRDKKK